MDAERSLATVLFTDIVGSTEKAAEIGDLAWRALLHKHRELVRRQLRRYGGRDIATAGDGFLATFEEPAPAILCACAIRDAVRSLGLEVRSGLHVGAVEWEKENVGGIAVHIGARVAGHAAPGEVLVSSTVRDLEAGSGFIFEDRGLRTLKGVPGEWRLFAVASCPSVPAGVRRRVPRARVALGRGVLAGVVVFLLLFLAAGLYVGVFSRTGERADKRLDPAGSVGGPPPSQPPETPSLAGTQDSIGHTPGGVPPLPTAESRPAAEATPSSDTTPPAAGTSDAATAPEEERARSSYESARRAAAESRRAALEAGAILLSQDVFQQAEDLQTAALTAARQGSYLDAEQKMREAEEAYDRAASVASWRGKLDSARRAVRLLRDQANRRTGAYRTGESWERRAGEAETAERYAEAVDHLGKAAEAYRKAGPPARLPPVPPAAPPRQRRADDVVAGEQRAPAREEAPPRIEGPEPAPPAEDQKPPAAKVPDAPATPPEQAVDRDAIDRTLGEVRRAIESEDLEALRRAWVSLTPSDARNFERWFSLIRAIKVRYDVRSVRTVGDRIVVDLQTTYELFNESTGQKERRVFAQVLELEEREGRWVVVASRE